MNMRRVGEVLNAMYLDSGTVEPVQVRLTPRGISQCIGTDEYSMLSLYSGVIPISLVYPASIPEDVPVTVKVAKGDICGPVLFFGRDDSPRSLMDFEYDALRMSIRTVRSRNKARLVLEGLTSRPDPRHVVLEVEG